MNILKPLGYTPEHTSAIDAMDKNFTGSQFDYAAASTKDMVDRASNPLTAVASAVGNVVGRPAYDFVDAAQKYSDKGYQGEFSFSPQGAVDFLGNLKSLGEEFLAQKPHIMMGGALKGGIESLGTQLGEGIYDYIHGPQMKFKQQLMNKKKQKQADVFKKIKEKQLADAAAKAKADAAAAAAAAKKQYSGQGAQGGGGGTNIGGGQQTSSGIAGGRISHSAAKAARGSMSGWGLADGGIVQLLRYGGMVDG